MAPGIKRCVSRKSEFSRPDTITDQPGGNRFPEPEIVGDHAPGLKPAEE
jgi:hypothetical protein